MGPGTLRPAKDQLISWRYVQPLSVEDHTKDIVTLSVAREQALELPSEDLADALEVLSGDEQQAMFAALDPDKAAEVLVEAEPRAKRQLIAFLRRKRRAWCWPDMSVPQIADLFSNLPHAKADRADEMPDAAARRARPGHPVQRRRAGVHIDERPISRVHARSQSG